MFTPHHVSDVTCQMSRVTRHMSCVTCHVLRVTFFLQSGWASRWRVCYQQGLSRLVSNESAWFQTAYGVVTRLWGACSSNDSWCFVGGQKNAVFTENHYWGKEEKLNSFPPSYIVLSVVLRRLVCWRVYITGRKKGRNYILLIYLQVYNKKLKMANKR